MVWGAGSYTLRLLGNSPLGHCNIIAFIDNDSNKQGTYLHDVKVLAPEAVEKREVPIVVCSALHAQEIIEQIKQMGLENEIIIP